MCTAGCCTRWTCAILVAVVGIWFAYFYEWIIQDAEDVKLPNLAAAPANFKGRTWRQHFTDLMTEMKETKNPEGINPKCEPYLLEPVEGTPVRGLQVLVHGFSACPGHWYNLAPRLLEKGWMVMAPLQPGHGRMPKVTPRPGGEEYDVHGYVEDLPKHATEYAIFAKELIHIARKFKAEHGDSMEIVLTGISIGGTVVSKIILDALEVWDRVLVQNPFMSLPSSMLADFGISSTRYLIPKLAPLLDRALGNMPYGETCNKKLWPGNSGGTGAICELKYVNLQKVIEFANIIEREFRFMAYHMGILTGGVLDRMLGMFMFNTGYSSDWFGVRDKDDRRCCCKSLQHGTTCKLLDGNELRIGRGKWDLFCPSQIGYKHFMRFNFTELPASCAADLELVPKKDAQPRAKVQLVTTVGDAAIANSRLDMISKVLMSKLDTSFSFCVWPSDLGHVYIAPLDHYYRDHWWLVPNRTVKGKIALDLLEEYLHAGSFVPKIIGKLSGDRYLPGALMCDLERAPGDSDREPLGLSGSNPATGYK